MGCNSPTSRIDSASSASFASLKTRRGCQGLGTTSVTDTCDVVPVDSSSCTRNWGAANAPAMPGAVSVRLARRLASGVLSAVDRRLAVLASIWSRMLLLLVIVLASIVGQTCHLPTGNSQPAAV